MAWPEIKKLVAEIFSEKPEHLRRGALGENAAKAHLKKAGLKFLTANFKHGQVGEIDLIFRDRDCLVFVEVKTRSSEDWVRPAAAVDEEKQIRIRKTAAAYRRLLPDPARVKWRYDIIEVLLEQSAVREVRHIENAFHF